MNLLAIDCASSFLSAAVCRGDEVFCEDIQADMKHSELVMDFIDTQMKKASLSPGDLNGVMCMGGPGSFTGLRIGYSIAKGLALSLSIPCAAVPTLDCIAFPFNEGTVIPVIQARKDAYFFTMFRGAERLMPDTDADTEQIVRLIGEKIKGSPSNVEKTIITGPGASALYTKFPKVLQKSLEPAFENRGYAKEIIAIAKKEKILDNDNTAYLYAGPEYIRKTDAELNLAGKPDR